MNKKLGRFCRCFVSDGSIASTSWLIVAPCLVPQKAAWIRAVSSVVISLHVCRQYGLDGPYLCAVSPSIVSQSLSLFFPCDICTLQNVHMPLHDNIPVSVPTYSTRFLHAAITTRATRLSYRLNATGMSPWASPTRVGWGVNTPSPRRLMTPHQRPSISCLGRLMLTPRRDPGKSPISLFYFDRLLRGYLRRPHFFSFFVQ